jgi:CcmD family protein
VTAALPDNTGYVAAAYLVFFALVLVYLVIMATKLARFERELSKLNELAEERESADEREAVHGQQRVVARPAVASNFESEPSQ